jgi:ADP-ribosylation factor family
MAHPPMELPTIGGLAGIRQLREDRRKARAPADPCAQSQVLPVHRQRKRAEDTHSYLSSKVDPVMSEAITYLLFARPQDVRRAMLDYFVARRTARDDGGRRLSFTELRAEPRAAQRHDRLYMAREIGPVMAQLINAVLRRTPDDVEAFLIGQLQDMLRLPRDASSIPSPRSPAADGSRPSTARARLSQAQQLDTAVATTTAVAAAAAPKAAAAAAVPVLPLPLAPFPPATASAASSSRQATGRHSSGIVVSKGVRESQTEHWDVSVAASAPVLPPSPVQDRPLSARSSASVSGPPKLACLLLLGLDGSGKTTLLKTLQGDPCPRVQPTVGFAPATLALTLQLRVKVYDLGGGARIRGIWQNYYQV